MIMQSFCLGGLLVFRGQAAELFLEILGELFGGQAHLIGNLGDALLALFQQLLATFQAQDADEF